MLLRLELHERALIEDLPITMIFHRDLWEA